MKKRLLIAVLVLASLMALCTIIWSTLFTIGWLIGINTGMIALILSAAFTLYVVIYYIITGKLP